MAVIPPIARRAWSSSALKTRSPSTTATSPSKSGRVSSRGTTMSSSGPTSAEAHLAKTTCIGHVQLRFVRMGAVVDPDREDLVRDDRVKKPDVAEFVLGPVGVGERLPGFWRRDEAAGPGRPSVADAVVVERADASVTPGPTNRTAFMPSPPGRPSQAVSLRCETETGYCMQLAVERDQRPAGGSNRGSSS